MNCEFCGVEWTKAENRCPICDTPAHPRSEPVAAPEIQGRRRLQRKGRLNLLLSSLCLLALTVTLAVDLALHHAITWSEYVIGAVVAVYLWLGFPLWLSKARVGLVLNLNYGVLVLYLWAVERAVGGNWFLKFALPILLMQYLFAVLVTLLVKRYPQHALAISGGAWIVIGGLMLLLETLIHLTFGGVGLQWSPYATAYFLTVGAFLLALAFSPALRDRVKKRLFI